MTLKTIIIDIVYLSYNSLLTIVVWLKQIEKKSILRKSYAIYLFFIIIKITIENTDYCVIILISK